MEELLKVCSQNVLKCLYIARIGRLEILWSVNKLARSLTKWTRACDKRLARLISYIHFTSEFRQCCHVGNTAPQCRLGLCHYCDFARDLEDTKNRLREERCVFLAVTRLFPEVGCARSRHQSHTDRRNLKLLLLMQVCAWMGSPLSMFGIWLLKCHIQNPIRHTNFNRCGETRCVTNHQANIPTPKSRPKFRMNILSYPVSIGLLKREIFSSRCHTLHFYNEAVVKMIIKSRSPTMRHVPRTHRVALDWLFDRINLDPKIQIKHVDIRTQLADILTKGNFTCDAWNHLLCLLNISNFSSSSCPQTMSKERRKGQEKKESWPNQSR